LKVSAFDVDLKRLAEIYTMLSLFTTPRVAAAHNKDEILIIYTFVAIPPQYWAST